MSDVDVQDGGSYPGSWRYRLTVPSPKDSRSIQASAERVLHVRAGCDLCRPWRGVSPFAASADTRNLLANVEGQLRKEASGPVGHVLPVPEPTDELAADIKALAGDVALVESGSQGADASRAPEHQWGGRTGSA